VIIGGWCGTRAWYGVMLILSFDARSQARPDEAILDRCKPLVDSGAGGGSRVAFGYVHFV
jgi:hypothetical protein